MKRKTVNYLTTSTDRPKPLGRLKKINKTDDRLKNLSERGRCPGAENRCRYEKKKSAKRNHPPPPPTPPTVCGHAKSSKKGVKKHRKGP